MKISIHNKCLKAITGINEIYETRQELDKWTMELKNLHKSTKKSNFTNLHHFTSILN